MVEISMILQIFLENYLHFIVSSITKLLYEKPSSVEKFLDSKDIIQEIISMKIRS